MTKRCVVVLAALLLSSPLHAETGSGASRTGPTVNAVLDACGSDMRRLCGDAAFGGGLLRCMAEHRRDISETCRATVADLRRAGQARREAFQPVRRRMRQACEADARSLCAGVEPGDGRLARCLRDNRDRVSEGCRSARADLVRLRQDWFGGREGRP